MLDPEEGYLKAKDILEENFGRSNVIARAYMDKLRSDVNIKADDEKDFVRLAHDLEESELTFRRLNLQSAINNFEMMAHIVKRLPYQSQTRWIRAASEIEKRGEDPRFDDLVNFVKSEAEVARSA